MFSCVKCGHQSSTFNAKIHGQSQGAFTYQASCPKCGSQMVNVLPGVKEGDLKISTQEK